MEPKYLSLNLKMEPNQMLCQQTSQIVLDISGKVWKMAGLFNKQLLYYLLIFLREQLWPKRQFYIVLLQIGTISRPSFHTMPSENVAIIRGPNFPQIFGQLTWDSCRELAIPGEQHKVFTPTICFSQDRRVGGGEGRRNVKENALQNSFPPFFSQIYSHLLAQELPH
jgi:hypothetical protein